MREPLQEAKSGRCLGRGELPLTPARKPPLCAGRGAGRGDYSPDAPPRPARLRRRDIDAPINYRKNKHVLYGEQEGMCAGCRTHFPFKVFDVDHIIPESKGGTDHIDNLQLLCSHCNRTKGNRPQKYLIARLKELEICPNVRVSRYFPYWESRECWIVSAGYRRRQAEGGYNHDLAKRESAPGSRLVFNALSPHWRGT